MVKKNIVFYLKLLLEYVKENKIECYLKMNFRKKKFLIISKLKVNFAGGNMWVWTFDAFYRRGSDLLPVVTSWDTARVFQKLTLKVNIGKSMLPRRENKNFSKFLFLKTCIFHFLYSHLEQSTSLTLFCKDCTKVLEMVSFIEN